MSSTRMFASLWFESRNESMIKLSSWSPYGRIFPPPKDWCNAYTRIAKYDFPVLLGPIKTVSGRRSTLAFAIGPKSSTSKRYSPENLRFAFSVLTATSTAALDKERGQGDASLSVG